MVETDQNETTVELGQDEIVDFYSLATYSLSSTLQDDLSMAQNSKNWRLLMASFNMLQMIDSSGIALIYGLRFFARGKLSKNDMHSYVEKNALRNEYFKNAKDLMPQDVLEELQEIFNSEEFKVVEERFVYLTTPLRNGNSSSLKCLGRTVDNFLKRVYPGVFKNAKMKIFHTYPKGINSQNLLFSRHFDWEVKFFNNK